MADEFGSGWSSFGQLPGATQTTSWDPSSWTTPNYGSMFSGGPLPGLGGQGGYNGWDFGGFSTPAPSFNWSAPGGGSSFLPASSIGSWMNYPSAPTGLNQSVSFPQPQAMNFTPTSLAQNQGGGSGLPSYFPQGNAPASQYYSAAMAGSNNNPTQALSLVNRLRFTGGGGIGDIPGLADAEHALFSEGLVNNMPAGTGYVAAAGLPPVYQLTKWLSQKFPNTVGVLADKGIQAAFGPDYSFTGATPASWSQLGWGWKPFWPSPTMFGR